MQFNSISFRIFCWFMIISLLPLILITEVFLSQFQGQILQIEFRHLSRMSDKKIAQISSFIDERIADIETLSSDPKIVNSFDKIIETFDKNGKDSIEYQSSDRLIRTYASDYLKAGYYDLFLISPKGDVIFSVRRNAGFATNLINGPYFNSSLTEATYNSLTTFGTNVSDYHLYPPSNEPAAFIATPIMKEGKLLGILALQLDINRLFDVALDNIGLGETGETVIARKSDGSMTFMGSLKFNDKPDSSLAISLDSDLAIPMQHALNGQSNHDFSIDYRGEEVIAAWSYLPALRWGIVVKKDVNEVLSTVRYMRKLSWYILLSLLITILVIVYFVGRSIVRPVRILTQVAHEIAAGDLKQRVEVKSHDEVGQLAETFNQMADKLQKSHLKLVKEVNEAERANQAKSEFLSRMSHELRTPMNAILGFAQILTLDAEDFTDTQRSNINEILDAGRHLLRLINELLDLTRIESGKMEIAMEKVCIDDILPETITLIKTIADVRNLTITDNISGKGYQIKADFTRLKQVMLNLLSNAVKYNQNGGQITLEAEIVNNCRLKLSVIDTGKGLSKEDISRLFNSFVRLDTINNVEGTGIGLVITKHLVELMGGTINVESTPGKGSKFWVELKLAKGQRK